MEEREFPAFEENRDDRGAVRRYETPRERKFLYWGLGFICGALCVALIVVLYDRIGGAPIGPRATNAPRAIAATEDKDFSRARKSVEATLDDPSAAVFEAMTVAANGQDKLICGYVSSKAEGANVRRTPFIYHTRADVSFVLSNRKEAFVAGPQIVNACFPTYNVPRTALEASRE
jgi:hypothetical protein